MRKTNSKKSSFPFYIIIIFLSLFLSCGKSGKQPAGTVQFTSYRDIPGITENEIKAVEALKSARQSFSFVALPSSEGFVAPGGTYAGFVPMFCELLTGLFDIPFVAEFYSWNFLKKGLDNLTFDFTGELTATSERMQQYHMTPPIAARSLIIAMPVTTDTIKTENDLNGRKVGFYQGTITARSVLAMYPQMEFEIVDLQNTQDAVEKMREGVVDAIITDANAAYLFLDYPDISTRLFFPLVYTPVSMTTANPSLKPIISVVTKYLTTGGIDRLYELYKVGNYEYAKHELDQSFTAEEKAYLENLAANGMKVPIALEIDNYPVCFYDENNKDFEGIAPDILWEINRLTGIEFDVVTNKNSTWAEIYENLKEGKIALVSELRYSEDRKNNFLWADRPYVVSSYIFMSKSGYPSLEMYQVSRARVGFSRGTIYDEMYNEWFPGNTNAVYFDNQDMALIALEKDEIDLLMTSEFGLLSQTNRFEKPGYKINIQFKSPVSESFFGFNKNEKILCSIISKSQNFIGYDEIVRTWTSRTYDYARKYARDRLIFMTVFSAMLFLLLLFLTVLLIRNRRTGKQLHEAAFKAEAASRAKGVFLATMSHEIRTPLNAIIGMSYILKDCVNNNEKALRSVDQIMTSSHHLLGILNDILDMSKIESGKLELTHEVFSLLSACNEVADIMTHRCEEKKISFDTNIQGIKDIMIIGDKLRLNQVLINLLGNAVKFTDENGEIKFIVKIIEESDENVKIQFTVSDNGIGINEEQISKLFIPFEQADVTIAARFGGTGLGLSLSQNFVKMMGAEIHVDSKPNTGSTFYFSIVFEKSDFSASKTSERKYDNLDLKGKRILLTEDIEINRLIVCELLSLTGVSIEEAENGQQAVDIFAASSPGYFDMILMDVQMPILDGYGAVKKIRALARDDAKTVPIIAMTAHAYKEDVDEALAAGMNGHLAKPIDKNALFETIGKLLKD